MKKMMIGKICGCGVLATFSAASLRAETLALYTFEGGQVGAAVTALPNAVNPGTYDAVVEKSGTVHDPVWTNNVPGNAVFSDAACTNVIAKVPFAVSLDNGVAESTEAPADGGCIRARNLGTRLMSESKFTIEWYAFTQQYNSRGTYCSFWFSDDNKSDGQQFYWTEYPSSAAAFYGGCGYWGSEGMGYAIPVVTNASGGAVFDTTSITYRGWKHYAIVIDRESFEVKYYYDGQLLKAATFSDLKVTKCTSDIYFGALVSWCWSDFSLSRHIKADFSCIRVSTGALSPDEFMCMGAAGFYAFDDKASGETVDSVENRLVPGSCRGKTSHCTEVSTVTPARFDSSAPGKYIYAGKDRKTLLYTNPGSAKLEADGYWGNTVSSVDFTGLAGYMRMMLDTHTEYTLEMFYKHTKDQIGVQRGVLAQIPFKIDGKNYIETLEWRYTGAEAYYNMGTDVSNIPMTTTDGEPTRADGIWHHAAIVLKQDPSDCMWKYARVYVDYCIDPLTDAESGHIQIGDAATGYLAYRGNYQLIDTNTPIRIGRHLEANSANAAKNYEHSFCGYISCVRLTPGALTPDRFMVASDTATTPSDDRILKWRFEDGTIGSGVDSAVDSVQGENWTLGRVTTSGDGTNPKGAYVKSSGLLQIAAGETFSANAKAVRFTSPADGTQRLLHTKDFSGLPTLHSASWTLEAFVRMASAPTAESLVIGRGRFNPTDVTSWYDLALTVQTDGRLALKGTNSVAGVKAAYASPDIGPALTDDFWHQVAVTYNAAAKTLSVWVDGAVVRTLSDHEQIDSAKSRIHVAQGLGFGAYVGLMDEVTFTGRALTAQEMMRKYRQGLVILLK